jgi:ketosteroid isomerase-like protein
MSGSSMNQDNLALEFFARLRAGEPEGVLELCAPGFTWTVFGQPGRLSIAGTYDRDGFLVMLGQVAAAFPEPPTQEIVAITESRERILVETHVSGRDRAGEPYHNDLAYVFEIAGDQITSAREYLDTMRAAEVFGE